MPAEARNVLSDNIAVNSDVDERVKLLLRVIIGGKNRSIQS